MARRFSAEGVYVVVADINDTDGRAVAADIAGEYVHLDVSDSMAWDKLIGAQADFDIVVLNAGVATLPHVIGETYAYPLEGVDNDAYQRIMRINLDGVVFGARAVIPGMVSRRSGHILATASLAGIVAIGPDPMGFALVHCVQGLSIRRWFHRSHKR